MDFKTQYNLYRKNGIEAGFLQNAIAKHCGVTTHTVKHWLRINKVSSTAKIVLNSFKIEDYQKVFVMKEHDNNLEQTKKS